MSNAKSRVLVAGFALLLVGFAAGFTFPTLRDAMRPFTLGIRDMFEGPPTIRIAAGGDAAAQLARFRPASATAPLVVDLHYWSGDHRGWTGTDARLDRLVARRGWNFIRPSLGGPNKTVETCCAPSVITGIRNAIDYAVQNAPVDRRAIYVIGGSGGAYTGLCALLSGDLPVKAYILWNPITDLYAWHNQNSGGQVSSDIRSCTASGRTIDKGKAQARSPLYRNVPAIVAPTTLFVGVNDGFRMNEGVLPTHGIAMFNRLSQSLNHSEASVSPEATLSLLEFRHGTDGAPNDRHSFPRAILLDRAAGPIRLVVFDGGHETLAEASLQEIDRLRSASAP